MRKQSNINKGDSELHNIVQAQEMHCPHCGRFLGYQAIVWGMVKIKCSKCKEWTTINIMLEE